MEKEKREFFIAGKRVCLGEDKIIYADFSGELTVDIVNSLYDFFKLHKTEMRVNGKVRLFIDITNSKKPSIEARKLTYIFSEDKDMGKIALVGAHPVARVLAAFFMGESRKKDVKFFSTKESAIVWLQE
jgi:hypothetical protein